MVPDGRMDGQTEWTDRRNGRTDGRTDDAKTISLRLRQGIKRQALPNPSDSRSGALSAGPGVVNH